MILLAIITFLALVLRTYQIGETFVFSGEFGHNLLAIKNTLGSGTIPLVGPPTSHPWLSFGPLYYWITYPVLVLGNWHPLSSGVIGVLIGTLIIPINYIFISNIFGKKVAIISSLLIAISPTWIMYSRGARFFFLVTPFFYPLFWSLHKLLEGSKDYLWITALSFGLMLNFHYSTVILTPVILLIIIFRYKLLKTGDYLKTLLILLITNLPLIIHDASSGFTMLGKFVLWIPYRFAGLAEARSIADDAKTFSRFSGQFFLQDNYLWEIIAIILLLVTLNVVTKSKAHFLLSLIFFYWACGIFYSRRLTSALFTSYFPNSNTLSFNCF